MTTNPAKTQWHDLEKRPDSWQQQLYLKGRKLRAYTVWSDMLVNGDTILEAADNWNSPLALTSPAFHSPAIDLIGIGPLWTGFSQRRFSPDSSGVKVQWHGRVLWLGIGCIRGTEKAVIDRAIRAVFKRYHLSLAAIAGIATLDIKADEQGLIAYCQEKGLPLKTFTAEELRDIKVPNPSAIVNKEGGTPSVAEAAALKMGETLLVSKQIEAKSVTVAVSLAARKYRG